MFPAHLPLELVFEIIDMLSFRDVYHLALVDKTWYTQLASFVDDHKGLCGKNRDTSVLDLIEEPRYTGYKLIDSLIDIFCLLILETRMASHVHHLKIGYWLMTL